MPRRFYEKDGSLAPLQGKTVAIIGYGSQGHAHALNLRDSGVNVVVGLYEGSKSKAKAEAAGLKVLSVSDAAKAGDFIMILLPDHVQGDTYRNEIAQHMKKGKTLMFAHGFNIHFNEIKPPADIDVSMVAPKAPGHRVRELFTEGVGVPALIAVAQDASGKAVERTAMGKLEKKEADHTFKAVWEQPLTNEVTPVRVLVAERRWNVMLQNGIDIQLPATGLEQALDTLLKLDRDNKILSRDIAVIDLRLADRVTVRLSDEAAAARLDALKKNSKKKGGAA